MRSFGKWHRLRRILGLPDVRQELPEFSGWRLAELGQHAGEVPLRIDTMAFGAGDERPQPRRVGGRGVMAGEEPGLDAREHLQRALPIAVLRVVKLPPRMGPAGDFRHVLRIKDAVVTAVGVRLQVTLITFQPLGGAVATAARRVVVDRVGMLLVAQVAPDAALPARVASFPHWPLIDPRHAAVEFIFELNKVGAEVFGEIREPSLLVVE